MKLTEVQDGPDRSPIRAHCAVSSGTMGSCARPEPAGVPDAGPYVAGHDCRWKGLPSRLGRRHTIPTRMHRRSRSGIPGQVFGIFPEGKAYPDQIEDSAYGRHHCEHSSRWNRRAKKRFAGPRRIPGDGPQGSVWLPRMPGRRRHSHRPGQACDASGDAGRSVAGKAGKGNRTCRWTRHMGVTGRADLRRNWGSARRFATRNPASSSDMRPGDVQAAQRSRTVVPAAEGPSPHPPSIPEGCTCRR